MRILALRLGLVAAVVGAIAACTVMNDLHLPPPKATDDASAPADASADAGEPCAIARVPAPPAPPVDGEDPASEILVAMRRMLLRETPALGYDLDGVCTCSPGPESCAVRDEAVHCDLDGGRDNAFATLSKRFTTFTGFDVIGYANVRLEEGVQGYLVRVQGYNGGADDSDVTVSVYLSAGTVTTLDDGGTAVRPPSFAEGEAWSIDPDYLVGDPAARTSKYTAQGYVSGNVLVAGFAELPLPLVEGVNTMVRSAVVTGRISKGDGGAPTIAEGILAGRIGADAMLAGLAQVFDPSSKRPFCDNPSFGPYARGVICPAADVTVESSSDGTNAPCDAISAGIAYEAVGASFGSLVRQSPNIDVCAGKPAVVCGP